MALGDYAEDSFTFAGKTRRVFRRGTGPAVIVISEVPGITPEVVAFADRVHELGCTAVLPHLFGVAGEPASARNSAQVAAWCCVSHEFATWAAGRTSPVTEWLRALGRHELARCGGPGIGAGGNSTRAALSVGLSRLVLGRKQDRSCAPVCFGDDPKLLALPGLVVAQQSETLLK